ncbi:GNAT family N-acetyltransferase [Pseudidiomarina sediminum]|uniref:GNAT family N-acetyltransferase n=1 Tax=Pseudidiomarina sediminum TaxID=431675 RepID=UPI001C96336F|nr:GNAT family N-acetyltransferase [Pseudidiomarina sediminum]MBY6064266.1 GNAT family N-acetyltransferase [Pseudidiomarina sediminum]
MNFVALDKLDPSTFLPLLNDAVVRKHLVGHEPFTLETVQEWVQEKLCIDAMDGYLVRAICVADELIGWCGIQPDHNEAELAIVLAPTHWGYGRRVFEYLMDCSRTFGHRYVVFHLLDSRREYKALRKFANDVFQTRLMGRNFTTYKLAVRGQFQ